jgi:predicted dehydrogenase
VEIYGTRGGVQIEGEAIVRWDTADPGADLLAGRSGAAAQQAAGAGATPTGISSVGHTRILADFADSIRSGRDPLVTGEEARRALAVVLEIYDAARA